MLAQRGRQVIVVKTVRDRVVTGNNDIENIADGLFKVAKISDTESHS